MTFDELWRLDLAKQQAPLDPMDKKAEIDLCDCSVFNDPGADCIDKEAVTQFVQWLEENLLSHDQGD